MDLHLSGKTIIVTGGSCGIGVAVVRQFLEEGANVASFDRAEPNAEFTSRDDFFHFHGDATDEQSCESFVSQVFEKWKRIDVLVNNIGVNDTIGLSHTAAEFEASLLRNITHYFAFVRLARESLLTNKGAIVNIGSKVSVTGQGGTSGYAAAKGAVNSLTREWALEFAPHGVRVNTVIPAEVMTDMYRDWLASCDDPQAEQQQIEAMIPLEKRFTTPEEIANTVTFLASPRSAHTTGQLLFVDGGYTHLDRRCT